MVVGNPKKKSTDSRVSRGVWFDFAKHSGYFSLEYQKRRATEVNSPLATLATWSQRIQRWESRDPPRLAGWHAVKARLPAGTCLRGLYPGVKSTSVITNIALSLTKLPPTLYYISLHNLEIMGISVFYILDTFLFVVT